MLMKVSLCKFIISILSNSIDIFKARDIEKIYKYRYLRR